MASLSVLFDLHLRGILLRARFSRQAITRSLRPPTRTKHRRVDILNICELNLLRVNHSRGRQVLVDNFLTRDRSARLFVSFDDIRLLYWELEIGVLL